jgi:hypothetical protein
MENPIADGAVNEGKSEDPECLTVFQTTGKSSIMPSLSKPHQFFFDFLKNKNIAENTYNWSIQPSEPGRRTYPYILAPDASIVHSF